MSNNYIWEMQSQPGGIFTYKGRINRKRFLIYSVVLYIVSFLAGMAHLVDMTRALAAAMMVFKVAALVLLAFNLIKRLHDVMLPGGLGVVMVLVLFCTDVFGAELLALTKSGGAAKYASDVLVLLSFMTICVFVYLVCKKGTDGPNKYGEDPLKAEGK